MTNKEFAIALADYLGTFDGIPKKVIVNDIVKFLETNKLLITVKN